jgi:hypothetical protein
MHTTYLKVRKRMRIRGKIAQAKGHRSMPWLLDIEGGIMGSSELEWIIIRAVGTNNL